MLNIYWHDAESRCFTYKTNESNEMKHFSVSFFSHSAQSFFTCGWKKNRLILCDSHNRCYLLSSTWFPQCMTIFSLMCCVLQWLLFFSILYLDSLSGSWIPYNIAWEILFVRFVIFSQIIAALSVCRWSFSYLYVTFNDFVVSTSMLCLD